MKGAWRDTQSQIADTQRQLGQLTNARITAMDRTARERDDQLRDRVDSLISAIGALTTQVATLRKP